MLAIPHLVCLAMFLLIPYSSLFFFLFRRFSFLFIKLISCLLLTLQLFLSTSSFRFKFFSRSDKFFFPTLDFSFFFVFIYNTSFCLAYLSILFTFLAISSVLSCLQFSRVLTQFVPCSCVLLTPRAWHFSSLWPAVRLSLPTSFFFLVSLMWLDYLSSSVILTVCHSFFFLIHFLSLFGVIECLLFPTFRPDIFCHVLFRGYFHFCPSPSYM